jgi:ribosomal protein L13E
MGAMAVADRREQRWRQPVNRLKNRLQDLLTGSHDLSGPG